MGTFLYLVGTWLAENVNPPPDFGGIPGPLASDRPSLPGGVEITGDPFSADAGVAVTGSHCYCEVKVDVGTVEIISRTPADAEVTVEVGPPEILGRTPADRETPGHRDTPVSPATPDNTEPPDDTVPPDDTERPDDTETPDNTAAPDDTETPPDTEPLDTENIHVDPESATPSQSRASEAFEEIMDDFLSTEFEDSESAAAYLQEQVGAAGIEVRLTANGYEAADRLPEPARVAAQLRARGIRDRAIIEQVVAEANSAIASVEDYVQAMQGTLPTTPEPDGPTQETNPFVDFIPAWMALVPGGFSALSPPQSVTSTSTATATEAPTNLTPARLVTMKGKGASGLTVHVNVATAVGSVLAGDAVEPGYHVAQFTSLFDAADWSLYA